MTIQYITTSSLTNYVSSLTIGSSIGYRISGGGILGPKPYMQTTSTLDGTLISFSTVNTETRILVVTEADPQGRFEAYTGVEGTRKAITLTNIGNSTMLVEAPVFSNRLTQAHPRYLRLMRPPWNIASGTSRTFLLSYSGLEEGTFSESIFFPTPTATLPYYRMDTEVVSRSGYTYSVEPYGWNTTTFRIGENSLVDYTITPRYFGVEAEGYEVPISTTLVGDPAWSYDYIGSNRVTVRFSSRGLTNNTTTYVSTLTIVTPNETFTRVNTATHSVNLALNYNTSTWISALCLPDVIVGMRIDQVQTSSTTTATTRLLTIGVGSGADGAPTYAQGGSLYFDPANLQPMEGSAKLPFAYWQTVYQIPLVGTASLKTYLSGDYKVKTQEPQARDYDYYFGVDSDQGSMFTIREDSEGYVSVIINQLRETSGDATRDLTLTRLSKVFYYAVPSLYSYYPNGWLGQTIDEFGQPDPNGTNCWLFVGFDNRGQVQLNLVPLPN